MLSTRYPGLGVAEAYGIEPGHVLLTAPWAGCFLAAPASTGPTSAPWVWWASPSGDLHPPLGRGYQGCPHP